MRSSFSSDKAPVEVSMRQKHKEDVIDDSRL